MIHALSRLVTLLAPFAAPAVQGDGVRLPAPGVVPEGEALIVELGCLQCHASRDPWNERLAPKLAPDLTSVGARMTPGSLRRFLQDPAAIKPGTSMPNLLAALPAEVRSSTIEDLVHFLVDRGGPLLPIEVAASIHQLEEGRQLFHEVGCVACHSPQASAQALAEWFTFEAEDDAPAVNEGEQYVQPGTLEPSEISLTHLAEQTSVEALQSFLLDPHAVRPAGRMPSMLLTNDEAWDIAIYLLRDQARANGGFRTQAGLKYEYFEEGSKNAPEFRDASPVRSGAIDTAFEMPGHREDDFGFRIEGQFQVETSGYYRFRTVSDDGSWLYVDGAEVVDNGGSHPMVSKEGRIELQAGTHSLSVAYNERGGGEGLEIYWTRPGVEERLIDGSEFSHSSLAMGLPREDPFELDAERIKRGAKAFEALGCVRCHAPTTSFASNLEACDPSAAASCTSATPRLGLPDYAWTESQRASVIATMHSLSTLEELTPSERTKRQLAANRCYSCHRREDIGGVHPQRRPYFFENGDVDLGEEGRIPPHLDLVGAKLEKRWLEQVLQEGTRVRPYLVTRMPRFGSNAIDGLAANLVLVDEQVAGPEPSLMNNEIMLAGRRLVGTKGFGCIQCHQFNGFDSLGIPAVDLGLVHDRIRYPWFKELLRDPESINMNTRMPTFLVDGASPVRDVLDGDLDRQIDAIWSYLGMGGSMPLPEGLNTQDSTYELLIEEDAAPVTVGVFMQGVSPRVVAVGTPEHVHYAFDVENSRLAMVWRGRFFNARGTWDGRAGKLELPASTDRLDLNPAPPFALLESEDAEWPKVVERRSPLRALGRRFDSERYPIFRYALGDIVIEERLRPTQSESGSGLSRRFRLSSPSPVESLHFLEGEERRAVQFQLATDGTTYTAEFESLITW